MSLNNKKFTFLIILIILLIAPLFLASCYISYLIGKSSCKKEPCEYEDVDTTTITSTVDNSIPEGWRAVEEETDLIYLTANIPNNISVKAKVSDLYITLSSSDNLVTLYIAGECEGCTAVPQGQENFAGLYTKESTSLMINGETCSRYAYISKETEKYELYEVTCLGDKEVHIWGECKDTKAQVELCDQICEGMVVENL